MAPQQRSEYADITAIIQSTLQSTLEPLMSKLDAKVDRLEVKVDHLTQDRVTRADVEKLRNELLTTMVPRDSYEARHAALIQRDTDIDTRLRKHENDAQVVVKQLYERFEISNHNLENQFKEYKKEIEEKLKDNQNNQLNDKDRHWVRLSQFFGLVAVIVSLAALILDHVRFQ